jgi:hypothetical protein
VGFGVGAVCLAGCGEPPPPAPSAVIRACPASVCVGDDFATSIHLDARKSAPRLTLVEAPAKPDAPPLSIRWSFSGSAWLFDDESRATEPDILVSMAADRPLHVTLTVENEVGGVSEALRTLSVTPLAEDGSCPLPSPADDISDDCLSIGPAGP